MDDAIRITIGIFMKQASLKSLSSDELWILRQKVSSSLTARITAEKAILEKRLIQLKQVDVELNVGAPERRRPPVLGRFRNPDDPSETWAGRGKRPRWLRKQLGLGKRIDDFRIGAVAA